MSTHRVQVTGTQDVREVVGVLEESDRECSAIEGNVGRCHVGLV